MFTQQSSEIKHRGYVEKIFTEARTSRATVQIVDHFLDGSEIHGCEDSHLLQWRITPEQLSAPGRLGDGHEFVRFGKLMFFPAGVPYATREFTQGERNRCLLCRFENELAEIISVLDEHWNSALLEQCLNINSGQIDLAMQRLWQEVTHPGFATEIMVDSLVTCLAVEVTRYFKSTSRPDQAAGGRARALSESDLKQINDFISNARGGCPTTAQLAALCNVTPSSFRVRFKQTVGQSLHAYVEHVRLERAKSFLINTEMMMKEIAYELGFTHQATFTSSFRRLIGLSPSEYRQTNRH
jgi:AraC family transcriptional regulator